MVAIVGLDLAWTATQVELRELGVSPAQAAVECARLMRRTFDTGGGGLRLVQPVRDIAKRAAL